MLVPPSRTTAGSVHDGFRRRRRGSVCDRDAARGGRPEDAPTPCLRRPGRPPAVASSRARRPGSRPPFRPIRAAAQAELAPPEGDRTPMARTTRLVGRHRGMHARRRLIALSSTIVMLSATLSTAPPVSAVTLVVDPDVNSSSVTGWGWHTNATPTQINAFVGLGNRIVDLEVNSTAPTFSVAYVANSGTQALTSGWYYGLPAAGVSSQLTAHAARPIDVEPYVTSSGLRFAVVMVANTGAAQKGWSWYYGQTSTQIASYLSIHNSRIVDLDRYATSAGDRFDVVYIPNTGVDATAWWYYYGQTPTQVNAHLSANHARLISLERTASGTYDIVMAASPGLTWWWYYGQTATSLGNLASQKGARIARVEPYVIGSTRYFAAVLINDVNAETSRIRNLVSSKMAGSWGFFVKKVNGGEVVGLQPDRIFEPASMIKIVHAVTALRQVQANTGTTLSTQITWYA